MSLPTLMYSCKGGPKTPAHPDVPAPLHEPSGPKYAGEPMGLPTHSCKGGPQDPLLNLTSRRLYEAALSICAFCNCPL